MKKTTPPPVPASADYSALVDNLAVLTEATNQLAELATSANDGLAEILDDLKNDYARLQETVSKTEAAIELIARRHPEWFAKSKTLKTPYGEVKFVTSNPLDIPSPELTLVLVKQQIDKGALAPEAIRTREELNLEVLGLLDDSALHALHIQRLEKENVTIKPRQLDLGKAVADAEQKSA